MGLLVGLLLRLLLRLLRLLLRLLRLLLLLGHRRLRVRLRVRRRVVPVVRRGVPPERVRLLRQVDLVGVRSRFLAGRCGGLNRAFTAG